MQPELLTRQQLHFSDLHECHVCTTQGREHDLIVRVQDCVLKLDRRFVLRTARPLGGSGKINDIARCNQSLFDQSDTTLLIPSVLPV